MGQGVRGVGDARGASGPRPARHRGQLGDLGRSIDHGRSADARARLSEDDRRYLWSLFEEDLEDLADRLDARFCEADVAHTRPSDDNVVHFPR